MPISSSSQVIVIPGPKPGVYFSQALSPTVDPVHIASIWDDFVSGGDVIGALTWYLFGVGATASVDGGEADHPGVAILSSGVGELAEFEVNLIIPQADIILSGLSLVWIFRDENNIDATRRIGMAPGFSGDPPPSGIYLEHLPGETVWYAVVRGDGGIQARVDTGIAVTDTLWHRVNIIGNSAANKIDFYIDDILTASMDLIASVMPVIPGMQVIPNGAFSREMRADLFWMLLQDLQR